MNVGHAIRSLVPGSALLAAVCAGAAAQQPSLRLDSLFIAHRLPLEFAPSAMAGAGWDFIVREAAASQFVMVGESHNVREIPPFTARLFAALHQRAGFQYLALENGPAAMSAFGSPAIRGNPEAAFALANRYVSALQFRTDQELEMIVAAGALSRARDPLWGLDQEWGAQHILDRLAALAPDSAARTLVRRMLDGAAALETFRPDDAHPRYINRRLTGQDMDALQAAFANGPAEASRLVEGFRTSFEIYATRTGPPDIYRSNHRREQYMRTRFMEQYRAAVADGDTLPRVVLKFGQWHALRGVLNWGDVEPLGTFLAELARANGSRSLHIWTGLVNEPGHEWTLHDFPEYVPLANAGTTDRWWVVDMREIRPFVAAGMVAGMNDELRKVILGFDLALLIGSGNRATTDRLRTAPDAGVDRRRNPPVRRGIS